MFGLNTITTYIIGGLGVLLLIGAVAFWIYFQYAQAEIKSLAADNAKLETAVTILKDELQTRDLVDQIQEENQAILREELQEADKKYAELQKLFARHNLEQITREKPTLIERKINNATKKVFEEFERLSDPKGIEDEINSK